MMKIHFLCAQRFPGSGSKIPPVKKDRMVPCSMLKVLLFLLGKCVCVCVCVAGMEPLSHSFTYSFHVGLEISHVPGRYDTWKPTSDNSHQQKSLHLMELIHQCGRQG